MNFGRQNATAVTPTQSLTHNHYNASPSNHIHSNHIHHPHVVHTQPSQRPPSAVKNTFSAAQHDSMQLTLNRAQSTNIQKVPGHETKKPSEVSIEMNKRLLDSLRTNDAQGIGKTKVISISPSIPDPGYSFHAKPMSAKGTQAPINIFGANSPIFLTQHSQNSSSIAVAAAHPKNTSDKHIQGPTPATANSSAIEAPKVIYHPRGPPQSPHSHYYSQPQPTNLSSSRSFSGLPQGAYVKDAYGIQSNQPQPPVANHNLSQSRNLSETRNPQPNQHIPTASFHNNSNQNGNRPMTLGQSSSASNLPGEHGGHSSHPSQTHAFHSNGFSTPNNQQQTLSSNQAALNKKDLLFKQLYKNLGAKGPNKPDSSTPETKTQQAASAFSAAHTPTAAAFVTNPGSQTPKVDNRVVIVSKPTGGYMTRHMTEESRKYTPMEPSLFKTQSPLGNSSTRQQPQTSLYSSKQTGLITQGPGSSHTQLYTQYH